MRRAVWIILFWALLSSFQPHSHGREPLSTSTEQSGAREYRFLSLPPPPSCEHLYNVGKSVEWQNCMGVGPK